MIALVREGGSQKKYQNYNHKMLADWYRINRI
jgi:hypothetical protein